ncbi:transmembrane protein 140 [Rhinatrema bivittatum]|uniref:transmembrane protein 140 n=1 Tax=Rhinatrema bivittatum TaxID=194408 RepID=UPI00112683C5|nr:transmembrane protein 140 [Rhinatrema bivittatum]XP_029453100.1 transmembrane protein 140 [Rhinatrema bivittatum]XP_029453101.1 transmembrane protein 140 [Rhinatrema bivittatum]
MKMGDQLRYWVCLALSAVNLSLLFYALLFKAGNVIDTKTERIGFYNFCLWSEPLQEHVCYDVDDLKGMSVVYPYVLMGGRVCVYATLPLCLFILLVFILVRSSDDERDMWQFAVCLLAISVVALSIGLGTFLAVTCALRQSVELNFTCLALCGVWALLLLQLFLARSLKKPLQTNECV